MEALRARSTPDRRRLRGLTVLVIAAFAGSAVLVGAGVRASRTDGAVVSVENVAAATVPPTAPLVVSPTTSPVSDEIEPVTSDPVEGEQPSPGPTTTSPPVASTTTVVPWLQERPEPVGIRTDRIDLVGYPIRDVGLEDDGQMEIPDATEIGWYKYGATAGRPGATVLAAHVDWNGDLGPFYRLGTMEPGDLVVLTLDDGTNRTYVVTERTMYGKLELPKSRIWRNSGPEELVLITCGGDFNPDINRYRHNIVVYAAPVG